MKKLFRNITESSLSKIGVLSICVTMLGGDVAQCFQTELGGENSANSQNLTAIQILESGQFTPQNIIPSFYWLGVGDYRKAIQVLTLNQEAEFPWLRSYLEGFVGDFEKLQRVESDHFIFFFPKDQVFLKEYAIPSTEKAAAYIEKFFGFRPKQKIRVEIYPDKESFSRASTLSEEILERSGAIGICKFHRLMIMSPKSLPLGYRWLDALAHEYTHLTINELSSARTELWLHEGTAHYFDSAYRSNPPQFLTPRQKSDLKTALTENKLVTFKRMSPSLVYLKDQDEVSLAFSQVSHAVSILIGQYGPEKFSSFLKTMKKLDFPSAFQSIYKMTPDVFEGRWKESLEKESWSLTKGAMSDDVLFRVKSDEDFLGADAQAKMRLGDRMRMVGRLDAALVEYEDALTEEPDNPIVLLKLARVSLKTGQKEKAVSYLKQAILKNPNYGTPYIDLAKLVGGGEAEGYLMEANAINPFNPEIHDLLAKTLREKGDSDRAALEESIVNQLNTASE